MKGIIHMCKKGVGVPELNHNYKEKSKRCASERKFKGSRVFDVFGDARGAGVIMTEPGYERGMLTMVGGPHADRKGRAVRQAILSLESMPDASSEKFDGALRVLSEAATQWVETYAPNCRWVAFIHQDRHHPHVHIAFENWDYKRGRRLDFTPAICSEMQNMQWCASLGIKPGKGSLGRVINGQKLAAAGVDLSTAKTWHERVELCAWNAFASRKEAARELLEWCVRKQPAKSVDGLLEALLGEPLPPGWELKHRTKAGGDLREPAVKIGGNSLRLSTFLDAFVPKLVSLKPTKEKPEAKAADAPAV